MNVDTDILLVRLLTNPAGAAERDLFVQCDKEPTAAPPAGISSRAIDERIFVAARLRETCLAPQKSFDNRLAARHGV
jgi:hypothetical protein